MLPRWEKLILIEQMYILHITLVQLNSVSIPFFKENQSAGFTEKG